MFEGKGIKLRINEVATRDGLQNEAVFVETDDKVQLVDQLSGLGYSKIEVTSFTSPTAIPALKDAEAVMHRIRRAPGVVYTALIPNARGGRARAGMQGGRIQPGDVRQRDTQPGESANDAAAVLAPAE